MYRPGANSISVIRSAISLSAFGPTPEKRLTLPSSVVFCFLVIATASSRNVRARCFLLYPVVPYAGDTADVFAQTSPRPLHLAKMDSTCSPAHLAASSRVILSAAASENTRGIMQV